MKFNFDPIDYANIDKIEFWVVEDEEPPFLDHEEIENALYEEGAHPIEEGSSSHVQKDMDNEMIEDDDDINLESFGDEDDAPPGFRDKNHHFLLKMKKMRMRMRMPVVEHLDHMMILISIFFITNEAWVLKLISFFSFFGLLLSYTPNVTVAIDGSGDYQTITAAVKNIPMNRKHEYVIFIKKGTYNESIYIGMNMSNLVFIGDGKEKTMIAFSKSYASGFETQDSATLDISANDVLIKGISIVNSAGSEGGQAVALRTAGDNIAVYQCSIKGYQDTLLTAYGQQFFRESEIYAQGRGEPKKTGTVLHNCSIIADKELEPYTTEVKTFLGRPWMDYSQTIVMECFLGDLIDPEGWLKFNNDVALSTLHYVEYGNRGPRADAKGRITWPGHNIVNNPNDVQEYTVNRFINGTNWLPRMGVPFEPRFIN
ncbi:hypothetical protein CMV_020286 [Castanea mollissima]|uniref:Pectinesterase catalytic domain-containing protein n=1 Tax=Castanea mollissima TaxID=60419 RepID=A0A8J4VMV6_9ROSI|nr:hypothetical protein CMV_020286 [Castanea mollissima]